MFYRLLTLCLLAFSTASFAEAPNFKTIIVFGSGGDNYSHFPAPLDSTRTHDASKISHLFKKYPSLDLAEQSKAQWQSALQSTDVELALKNLFQDCHQIEPASLLVVHYLALDTKHPEFELIDGNKLFLTLPGTKIEIDTEGKTIQQSIHNLLTDIQENAENCKTNP